MDCNRFQPMKQDNQKKKKRKKKMKITTRNQFNDAPNSMPRSTTALTRLVKRA